MVFRYFEPNSHVEQSYPLLGKSFLHVPYRIKEKIHSVTGLCFFPRTVSRTHQLYHIKKFRQNDRPRRKHRAQGGSHIYSPSHPWPNPLYIDQNHLPVSSAFECWNTRQRAHFQSALILIIQSSICPKTAYRIVLIIFVQICIIFE